MKHYRVDKMRNMEVLKLPRSEDSLKRRVDLASFGKKTFGMFGGVDAQVKLVCANYLAGVVLDRFGPDIWMLPCSRKEYAVCCQLLRKLDFSKYDDMVVGLPYNLHFTVREVNGTDRCGGNCTA